MISFLKGMLAAICLNRMYLLSNTFQTLESNLIVRIQ